MNKVGFMFLGIVFCWFVGASALEGPGNDFRKMRTGAPAPVRPGVDPEEVLPTPLRPEIPEGAIVQTPEERRKMRRERRRLMRLRAG